MVIWVFYKHAISSVGPEVERDVGTGAGLEGGERQIGGLGESYSVPDTP